MRVLFDLAHPAHVHLFRNLIARLHREGHETFVAARDKDVTLALCRGYGIDHTSLSRPGGSTRAHLAAELFVRTARLLREARRFRPDAMLGTSVSIGLAGRLLQKPSFVFNEDDAHIVPLFARLAYPLASYIVTPDSLAHEKHGSRHLTYPGFHELAYLHPDNFKPDPGAVAELGLGSNRLLVVRFVSLSSHHDSDARGLGRETARTLVERLSKHGRVIVSSETRLSEDLEPFCVSVPPHRFHDVLAHASLYVGDSQTVAIEAGVLGVPSFRCNGFVGRISCLEQLEHDFNLTRGFLPNAGDSLIHAVETSLESGEGAIGAHAARRARMLRQCVDLSAWQWDLLMRSAPAGVG